MRTARRSLALISALVGVLALTSCGGANSAYCTTLTDNSDVAATVFAAVAPGMSDQESVRARLDLLAEVEDSVPEDLSEDFATWTAYLEEVEPLIGSEDPADTRALIEAGTDEVDAASDALFEHYVGTCMD